MRIISWFLATVLVLLLGISLTGKPTTKNQCNMQEAAEVQMEPVLDTMADVIISESVPYSDIPAPDVLYAAAVNGETERSEDRTVYHRYASALRQATSDIGPQGDYPLKGPLSSCAGSEHNSSNTFAIYKEVPFPLEGPHKTSRLSTEAASLIDDIRSLLT